MRHFIVTLAVVLIAAAQNINAKNPWETVAKIGYKALKTDFSTPKVDVGVKLQNPHLGVPKVNSTVNISAPKLPSIDWYTDGVNKYRNGDFEAARLYFELAIKNAQNRGRAYTYLAMMENDRTKQDSLANLALRYLGKNDRLFRFQATCLTTAFINNILDSTQALETLNKALSLVDEKTVLNAEKMVQRYYIFCLYNAALHEPNSDKSNTYLKKIIDYPTTSNDKYIEKYKNYSRYDLSANAYISDNYELCVNYFDKIYNIETLLLEGIDITHAIYSYGATGQYDKASLLLRASAIPQPEEMWNTILCWDNAECINDSVCKKITNYLAWDLALDDYISAEELYFIMYHHVINSGDIETAYNMYEHCNKVYRANSTIYYLAGAIKHDLGEYEKAITCYDKALATTHIYLDNNITADSAQILYYRGLSNLALCDIESAYTDFKTVPNEIIDTELLPDILYINLIQGDYENALEQSNILISNYPDSNEYYFYRAVAYEGLDMQDKAAEDYRRIIDDKDYRHWALLFFNEKKEAEKAMRSALKSDSTDMLDYTDAAEFYLTIGKNGKARKMLKKAATSAPNIDECTIKELSYSFKDTPLEGYFNELFLSK